MKPNKRKVGVFSFLHTEFAVNILFVIVALVICIFCANGITNASSQNLITYNEKQNDLSSPLNEIESGSNSQDENQNTIANNTYITLTFVRATVSGLNIRQAASSSSAIMGYMDKDDMCLFVDNTNGWNKIFYKGEYAYISEKYSEFYSLDYTNQTIVDVILSGAKMIGVEYVYGAIRMFDSLGNPLSGFSDDAFDCSSFTQYAFYMGAGLKIDVTTRTQVFDGQKTDEILPGDLLFFTNSTRYYNEGIERIGHVGIYLGNNYILHTASDYAVIEQISDLRWSYFIQSNRLIFD
ncbi:MAG TPA: SH3 domain-containing C40 family peptidase [Clostridia bacterium]|nr:SH3 domain-containing C40 family peptidase [Clostridia bacterium]